MDRNRGTDFAVDINGAGRDGFTNGDPSGPVIPASEVDDEFLNEIQEEVVRTIEILNGTPSHASKEQLGTLLLGLFSGTGTLAAPVSVTLSIPARSFTSRTGTWTESSNGEILTASTNAAAIGGCLSDFLPDGAVITDTRVMVDPGAGNTMSLTFSKRTLDFATPGIGSQTLIISGHTTTGVALQTIHDATGDWAGEVANKSGGEQIQMTLTAGNAGTNADIFYGVQVVYTDVYPGKR